MSDCKRKGCDEFANAAVNPYCSNYCQVIGELVEENESLRTTLAEKEARILELEPWEKEGKEILAFHNMQNNKATLLNIISNNWIREQEMRKNRDLLLAEKERELAKAKVALLSCQVYDFYLP